MGTLGRAAMARHAFLLSGTHGNALRLNLARRERQGRATALYPGQDAAVTAG